MRSQSTRGFTLPTVMIVSIVMFGMLAIALQFVAASSISLRDIYYNQLAREAVESGTAHAEACLSSNGYVSTWTTLKPLKPNTDCSGNIVAGVSAFVLDAPGVQSSYTVNEPVLTGASQRVSVSGGVNLTTDGGSTVSKSYGNSSLVNIGAKTSFDTVTFGYILNYESSAEGAFFGVIDAQNRALMAGYNSMGQLGNGSTTNNPLPVLYRLPSGVKAKKMFTSFLSIGGNLFVTGSNNKTYGSGRNDYGQIGAGGAVTAYSSTPREVLLPSGVSAQSIGVGRYATYFIGSDSRVYATGACSSGRLGDGRSEGGCSGTTTPVRVNVFDSTNDNIKPVPASDWLQSTNIAVDNNTVYVRTISGRVYGWGLNDEGQLATGDYNTALSPVQIGTFGNSGQPKATQIAFDGGAVYIVADDGKLYVAGRSQYGQLLGAGTRLRLKSDQTKCLTYEGAGAVLTARGCGLSVTANQRFAFRPDKRVESSGYCIERASGGITTGTNLVAGSCSSTYIERQDWETGVVSGDNKLYNNYTSRCLDATVLTAIKLGVCSTTAAANAAQEWIIEDAITVREVPLPAGTTATRVTTDQRSAMVLLNNGEVWAAGANHSGQLGVGLSRDHSTVLKKMVLPSGRTAVDVYTAMAGSHNSSNTYSNTFVVLDNGDVVGAGSNQLGNLGIGTMGGYYTTPQKMSLPSGVRAKSVQTGLGTTVILSTTGQIYTVGNNANGQLGDGTTTNSSIPAARPYVNVLPPIIY